VATGVLFAAFLIGATLQVGQLRAKSRLLARNVQPSAP